MTQADLYLFEIWNGIYIVCYQMTSSPLSFNAYFMLKPHRTTRDSHCLFMYTPVALDCSALSTLSVLYPLQGSGAPGVALTRGVHSMVTALAVTLLSVKASPVHSVVTAFAVTLSPYTIQPGLTGLGNLGTLPMWSPPRSPNENPNII